MRRTFPFFLALATSLGLLLVGCGQPQPPPPTMQVDGTLLTRSGAPRSGLTVRVDGMPTTTTDAAGAFTFGDVPTPYRLTGLVPLPIAVHAFENVVTDVPQARLGDEVLSLFQPFEPTGVRFEATVQITLPIGVAADTTAVVCGESGDAIVSGCLRVDGIAGAGPHDWQVDWFGAAEIDLKVHVLYVGTDANGLPIGFPDYAAEALSGLRGGSTVPFSFAPSTDTPAVETLDVTVRSPDLLADTRLSLMLRISDRLAMPITRTPSAPVVRGAPTSLTVPLLGNGGVDVVGRALVPACPSCTARSVAWRIGVAPGTSVELDLAAPPLIVHPLHGANDVDFDTDLRVDDRRDGVVTFFAMTEFFPPVAPQLVTSKTDVGSTLPDPSAFGYDVPSGSHYLLFATVTPDLDDPTAWLNAFAPVVDAEFHGGPGGVADGTFLVTFSRRVSMR